MGLAPRPARQTWEQRLAALDRLLHALGPTAAHALLVLAPQPSVASDLAAAAAAAAATAAAASAGPEEGAAVGASSDGGGPTDPQAAASEAAEVVRWYRTLRKRRRIPRHVAEALAARGLELQLAPAAAAGRGVRCDG